MVTDTPEASGMRYSSSCTILALDGWMKAYLFSGLKCKEYVRPALNVLFMNNRIQELKQSG